MESDPVKPKRQFTGIRCDVTKLPKCGAHARSTGKPCQRPAEKNQYTGKLGRCYFHGSRNSGPRSPEARERVAAAHLKHGRYSQATLEAKQQLRERLAALKTQNEAPK